MGIIRHFIIENFSSFTRLSKWGFNAGAILALAGFFSGPWPIACGLITMGVASLLYTIFNGMNVQRFKNNWVFILSVLIPVSVLISCIGTNDWHYAWDRIRVSLGFCLIPLLLFFSPQWPVFKFRRLLVLAGWGAILSLFAVLIHYLLHQEEMTTLISRGQPIPTPVNHIRFSMALSLTGLGFFYSWINNRRKNKRGDFIFFLLIILGTLALPVRTGWLLILTGIFVILVIKIIQLRSFKYFLFLILSILILFAIVWTIPSSKQKWSYMMYDLQQVNEQDGAHYSDSDRYNSLINSIDLILKHPITGIGTGDKNEELQANGQQLMLHLPVRIPHNQFIYTTLFGGLISLSIFFIGFLFPMFTKTFRRNKPLQVLLLLFTITMLYEPTFETSIGVLMYVYVFSFIVKAQIDLQNHSN